jgi:YegS/Rv2252/BmrU family lipid kinase
MAVRPAIIINASSGLSDKNATVELLSRMFDKRGLDASISLAEKGSKIIELTDRAVRDGREPIVAGGGDGTVNAVASRIIATGRTLGVLPLGTFNHFAKDLKIPLDLEEAAETILEGQTIRVDVGEVNDRIFLNNSSLGLYPIIVNRRKRQQQRLGRGKWPAFIWAALSVLRRYPFLNVRLHADEKELRRRTPFVFIGNNEYEMERFNIGARSRLDAGHLSLYIAQRTGRLGLLRLALHALFGGLRNEKDFDALISKEIGIETRHKRLHVAMDGEVTPMNTPLNYRILPRALSVIVPRKQ